MMKERNAPDRLDDGDLTEGITLAAREVFLRLPEREQRDQLIRTFGNARDAREALRLLERPGICEALRQWA